jgi:hypothetical protein
VGAALKLTASRASSVAQSWWIATKLMLLPAVALGIGYAFKLSAAEALALIVWAALPTASSAYILAARMGVDPEPVAAQITLQTLLSMVTIPVILAWAVS